MLSGGVDGGDAPFVAQNFHRLREAGQGDFLTGRFGRAKQAQKEERE